MSEPILYRYKPREGLYVIGLPQRDLTASDVAAVNALDLRQGVTAGLYVDIKAEKPAPAAPDKKAGE